MRIQRKELQIQAATREAVRKRAHGLVSQVPARGVLPYYTSRRDYLYQFVFPDGEHCTPLISDFANKIHGGNVVAIGDEDGRVSLIRTDKKNSQEDSDFHHTFYCHRHGVSDVKWSQDDTMLLTASYDRLVKLWDVETRKCLASFPEHEDLVRSANWHPINPYSIVSSSKDGSFRIYDMRCNQKDSEEENDVVIYDPIVKVPNAHHLKTKPTSSSEMGQTIRSVTCALFSGIDDTKVITSGSTDGAIKLWDARKGSSPKTLESTVFKSENGVPRGITDMKIDHSGSRLFSVCMDNSVYMHYLVNLTKPAEKYKDPDFEVNSFDAKLSVSPGGEFIMTGSSHQSIFVWETGRETKTANEAAYVFEAHSKRVSSVAWHKSTMYQFASCSEDFTTRIWHFDRTCMQDPDNRIHQL
ncbi:hypothetical protein G6F56_002693 [Rhizopus delemar]|nr:hypothetical protein G6F56_002693 [Rhizopus delemar]